MDFNRQVILLSLVLLAGCSTNVRIGDTEYPPRARDYQIEVFFAPDAGALVLDKFEDDARPARETPINAVEIGRTDSAGIGYGSMLGSARSAARKFGGDGVIIHGFTTVGWDTYLTTTIIRWKP